eukprot:3214192-Pleurochrysis_carterae.AAC.2
MEGVWKQGGVSTEVASHTRKRRMYVGNVPYLATSQQVFRVVPTSRTGIVHDYVSHRKEKSGWQWLRKEIREVVDAAHERHGDL